MTMMIIYKGVLLLRGVSGRVYLLERLALLFDDRQQGL